MKIFSIPDTEGFLDLVQESRGDVTLRLPGGDQLDLKQDRDAQQFFQMMHPGQSGLQISLSNPADAPAFIRYMMEAGMSN